MPPIAVVEATVASVRIAETEESNMLQKERKGDGNGYKKRLVSCSLLYTLDQLDSHDSHSREIGVIPVSD